VAAVVHRRDVQPGRLEDAVFTVAMVRTGARRHVATPAGCFPDAPASAGVTHRLLPRSVPPFAPRQLDPDLALHTPMHLTAPTPTAR
jgi:hypothetical protein